jgi:hypothetical protein
MTMKIFKSLFSGSGDDDSGGDRNLLWYYVRCKRCDETVSVMARKGYDLVEQYEESGSSDAPTGYSLFKDVMGRSDTCFQQMRIEIHFNAQYVEQSRHIEGGTFISAEEFRASENGDEQSEQMP